MKRKILLAGCALIAGMSVAAAQGRLTEGRIIRAVNFDTSHRLMFSQTDYIYGTSRTTAMGGAFTSLGADLSSMNINPAGLGMYQSSDWGITQSLTINSMSAKANMPVDLSSGGNRTSYGLNNVAMAWNIFNKSRGLTSLTFGFGYNRTANFNSRSYINTTGEKVSIGDMFFEQLDFMLTDNPEFPITPSDLSPSKSPFENRDIFLEEWGAVLGYQSGLIGTNSLGGYHNYFSDATRTESYMQSVTKGGLFDYTFSLGANINNILYLGATMGVTQVNYREDLTYEETYSNNPGNFSHMWYDQYTRIDGTGFTMKLGAVVRPVPSLRIGAAFHLPTYYALEKSYEGAMSTTGTVRNTGKTIDDALKMNSAPKLLTGISYVIADRAIISFDYERTWYNKIRMRDTDSREVEFSKNDSKKYYNPANTIRAGLEILASDMISIRAGGAYSMDFMTDDWVMNNPTVKSYYNISAGMGFNIGRNAYVDVTYLFNHSKYTKYDLFYVDNDIDYWAYQYDNVGVYDPGSDLTAARNYAPTRNRHMITLTIGSRF